MNHVNINQNRCGTIEVSVNKKVARPHEPSFGGVQQFERLKEKEKYKYQVIHLQIVFLPV